MANEEQLAILKQGVNEWNEWRKKHARAVIDLREADLEDADLFQANLRRADLSGALLHEAELMSADLSKANLSRAILSGADFRNSYLFQADLSKADLSMAYLGRAHLGRANLSGADLREANVREADLRAADLREANLSGADLSRTDLREASLRGADLSRTNLREANLSGVDLSGVDLREANLSGANFSEANLNEANLSGATLVQVDFQRADLTDCRIYGISAWDVKIEGAIQKNLVITEEGKSALTVDDLEVAQFIYLMLNNQKIKNVIDTITSKAVLILGRFTEERMAVLEAIREELRRHGYVPILFDFEPSASRDLTETVTLLARMARFIIADLTDPKSIPQELTLIIPDLPSVPVQPIILSSQREYAMYEHWRRYPWVQAIQTYDAVDDLLAGLGDRVIAPSERAIEKAKAGNKVSS
jgi:uncharacterized protein YjbI with pentapeptide repeats